VAILNPSLKTGLMLAALALAARGAVIAVSLAESRKGIERYAGIHDGAEYQQIARALGDRDAMRGLAEKTRRLSPGYPFAIRIASLAFDSPVAALGVSLVAAAIAVLLFFQITGDPWLSAYFAVFTPSWLLFSSVAMSEGLFLAVALLAFALWKEGRDTTAALALGALTLIRPFGVVLFAALWLIQLLGPNKQRCAAMLGVYLLAPLAWMIVSFFVWGNTFQQAVAYWERDYAPPVAGLFARLFSGTDDIPKRVLVWFTILTNFAALIVLIKSQFEKHDEVNLGWLLWLAFTSLFTLALPSSWAYACLDRFFVACLPAMMIGLRWAFPQRWWGVAIATAAGMGVCLYWNHNMLRTFALL